MAGRFPIFTDNHVQQALVDGLRRSGWDVVRAIEVLPEGTKDPLLFEHAAKAGRVFVSNDDDLWAIVGEWLRTGRAFAGLIYWHPHDYAAMTTGELLRAFEALAGKPDPFAYPVVTIRPPARAAQRERFKRDGQKRGSR